MLRTRYGFAGGLAGAALVVLVATGCAGGGAGGGGLDSDRLSSEDLAAAEVSTLYDAVQRLRPRWLEARGPRGMGTESAVVVFMDRTYLGGVEELRTLGTEVAHSLQFMRGAQAEAELRVPIGVNAAAAIIVHTTDRTR